MEPLVIIEIEDDIRCKNDSTFTFIHLSDTHGSLVSVAGALEYTMENECDFVALTGDILPDFKFSEALTKFDCPVFVIPGNHDAWHRDGLGQYGFRNYFGYRFSNNVQWADSLNNYWYSDIRKRDHILRVIGLDQFELDAIDNPQGVQAFMTQEQVDWFINVLEESDSCDGIVVLVHMGFGNKSKGTRISNPGKFVSELADNYNNSYDFYGPDDPYMIPEIINAYMTGENIDKTYGKDYYEKRVSTSFDGPHDNFIGYFGGHLHWDEVEYLKDFNSQLLCLIAFCGNGKGSMYNDLTKTDCSYNFNYNTIDLNKRTLEIHRVGAMETIGGAIRDSVSFSF